MNVHRHLTIQSDTPIRPQLDILPALGSPRSPCLTRCSSKWCEGCRVWWPIRERRCNYCDLPLGNEACFILIWSADHVAHLACQEDYLALEQAWLGRPTLVEAAAKTAGVSIEVFRSQFPSYDQARLVRPELESVYPDWRDQIQRELQNRRTGKSREEETVS